MKIKKITAAIAAAAVLAVAAPMTGTLPDVLSVTASAEEAYPTLQPGDVFWGSRDGRCAYDWEDVDGDGSFEVVFECTVLNDNTISVSTFCFANMHYYKGKDIVIPSEIGGYTVTEIASDCRGDYRSITIPKTVKTINQGAFANWFCCEEVIFEEGSQLELIDQWAFQNCRSLKSITIPASVETIAYGAFLNTSDRELSWDKDYTNTYSLKEVKFAEGSKLKTLGEYAFQNQQALTSIELPEGVTTIGDWAFRNCSALKSIAIPASVTTIGSGAFYNCSALKSIAIPASVEVIGDSVFSRCTSLENIIFEENSKLKTIGKVAFMGMPALKSIDLPASVETIGDYAFNPERTVPDSVLTAINVDAGNPNFKSVDGVLYTKDGKTLVDYPAAKSGEFVIPDGVTAIQQGAFQLAQITSLTIPEGVTELSEDAVCLCPNLSSVTLPQSLTKIGKWAFQGPNKLTEITIPESVTEIDPQAFKDSALKNINGVSGSYAETFANENGYAFNGEGGSTTFGGEDTEGVQVIAKPNVIPKDAHFQVQIDDSLSSSTRVAFNCFFTYNGANYEPTDTVTVKIPVPVGMQDIAETLKVYHYQDGKYVKMSATYQSGNPTSYLVFDTDHFSIYVVTAEELDDTDDSSSTPTTSDSTPNEPTNSDSTSSTPTTSDNTSSTPTTSDKNNPGTGVAAVATGLAVLAGAAVLVTRKKTK